MRIFSHPNSTIFRGAGPRCPMLDIMPHFEYKPNSSWHSHRRPSQKLPRPDKRIHLNSGAIAQPRRPDPSLTSPGGGGNKVPSVDLSSNQELCGGVARCQDYGHGQLPAEIISTQQTGIKQSSIFHGLRKTLNHYRSASADISENQ